MTYILYVMKKFFSRLFIWAVMLVGLQVCMTSCDDSTCTTQTDPNLRIRFQTQKIDLKTNRLITTDSTIWIHSIKGINAKIETISPIRRQYLNDIRVPLSQQSDATAFVLQWSSDTTRTTPIYTDTIQVSYQRQVYFVSEGCGFNYKFNTIAVKNQTFTSSRRAQAVQVINPVADEFLQTNIRIIF